MPRRLLEKFFGFFLTSSGHALLRQRERQKKNGARMKSERHPRQENMTQKFILQTQRQL